MNKARAILTAVINRQIANGGEVIIEQPAAHVYEMNLITKLERLLRFHRQNIFNSSGEYHHRAILRLKRTTTFKALERQNDNHASECMARKLERMGY